MSDQPPKSQFNDQLHSFLEFLSGYEEELYIDKAAISRSFERTVRPVSKQKPAIKPQESGLNPYPAYAPYTSLAQMEASIKGCLKCKLGAGRNKFVFGVGSERARVAFIGEGPGEQEDRQGEPFVGRAGMLLNQMLADIEWQREDVYICNVVKCRPPNNRDPLPEEITACEPYLHEQLRLLQPAWLVALGRIAAQDLLKTQAPLKALRGRVHNFQGISLWVTYHPAALLRNPNLMPDAHQDLLTLKRMVNSELTTLDNSP